MIDVISGIDNINNGGGTLVNGYVETGGGYAINVTQNGSACGGCDGTVRGFLAGDKANSAGVAYQISPSGYSATLAPNSITGTAAFTQ